MSKKRIKSSKNLCCNSVSLDSRIKIIFTLCPQNITFSCKTGNLLTYLFRQMALLIWVCEFWVEFHFISFVGTKTKQTNEMTKAAENSFKMLIKVQRQLVKQQNKENRQYNMTLGKLFKHNVLSMIPIRVLWNGN